MINRGVLLLKYRQPALDWINDLSGKETGATKLTLADLNQQRLVYLISLEDAEAPEAWLKLNYEEVFVAELESRFADQGAWPQHRSYKLFREWFDFECHSTVLDTLDAPIEDETAGLSLPSRQQNELRYKQGVVDWEKLHQKAKRRGW
ncbi:hypothetical protein CWE09_03840 [Aliidiomarina minuta]|uniref:Uncharacterized protein n=1 Tax=Aliidiomarina minuta TaxID=880057 RepID=A0A432W723_9GAMM|nr:hypothetical protein [Aliidiomarina minuta]RUO25868.1 hypothetical protein CWE09_03840 [Aliidiomarina minuta]